MSSSLQLCLCTVNTATFPAGEEKVIGDVLSKCEEGRNAHSGRVATLVHARIDMHLRPCARFLDTGPDFEVDEVRC
jgi:hypothetical protein